MLEPPIGGAAANASRDVVLLNGAVWREPGRPVRRTGGSRMKVRMLESRAGSQDGIAVETFPEGDVVDVCDDLGGVFVREGWAVPADAPAPRAEPAPAATKVVAPKRRKTPQNRKA